MTLEEAYVQAWSCVTVPNDAKLLGTIRKPGIGLVELYEEDGKILYLSEGTKKIEAQMKEKKRAHWGKGLSNNTKRYQR